MSYYFAPNVRTRQRGPRRYDDGGIATSYPVEGVPDIFSHVGRLGGKLKEYWWSSEEDYRSAHTYILLHCEELVQPFESIFTSQVKEAYPHLNDEQINKLKERDFASWLREEVRDDDTAFPIWFRELLAGPVAKVMVARMYCTGGYVFQADDDENPYKTTANHGVRVKGDVEFYGVLKQIIEVQYPGLVNLRCVLFKVEWYDPTIGRGVRVSKHGVVAVNESRRYNKFEPFILASQAEQVAFVPYPRVRKSGVQWLAVINIAPRGRIIDNDDDVLPMQQPTCTILSTTTTLNSTPEDINIIHQQNSTLLEDLDDDTRNTNVDDDEFGLTDDISNDEEDEDEDDD